MSAPSPTLKSLMEAGFTVTEPEFGMPCVRYDLPYLPLTCLDGVNKYFRQTVLVSGIYNDGRTLADINSEIPPDLDTPEAAAAWLVYALRSYSFNSNFPAYWYTLGQANQHLVPQVAEREAYKIRPRCIIDRDFARILRKRVADLISCTSTSDELQITFDGTLLRFTTAQNEVHVPGEGKMWTGHIVLPSAIGFEFPKRFSNHMICIDFWRDTIGIDRVRYDAKWVEGSCHE